MWRHQFTDTNDSYVESSVCLLIFTNTSLSWLEDPSHSVWIEYTVGRCPSSRHMSPFDGELRVVALFQSVYFFRPVVVGSRVVSRWVDSTTRHKIFTVNLWFVGHILHQFISLRISYFFSKDLVWLYVVPNRNLKVVYSYIHVWQDQSLRVFVLQKNVYLGLYLESTFSYFL